VAIRTPSSQSSIAIAADKDGKLHAPSAARNAEDICALLKSIAPRTGDALELASGTGQHIVKLAGAMPSIFWQASEVEPTRLESISAYLDDSGLANVAMPITLDATQFGWSEDIGSKDLVMLVNLLHLISDIETKTLISESAKVLNAGGRFFLYGPFKRAGRLTSEGDKEFDANIRANDPETGYKDDQDIQHVAESVGLTLVDAVEMPANNLALIFRK